MRPPHGPSSSLQDFREFALRANAVDHFRAALAPGGVAAHLLWRCPLGQVPLKSNDHLQERFAIVLRTTR